MVDEQFGLVDDERTAMKIRKVFILLIVFGGASVALFFLRSTLTPPSSKHPDTSELKRGFLKTANQHPPKDRGQNFIPFFPKDIKDRLRERVPNHPLLIGGPGRPVGLPGFGRPLKNSDVLMNHNKQHEPDATATQLATRFPFRNDFSFPQPKVMRSLDFIESTPWITDLRRYLSNYTYSREISLVTSNSKYIDVLLNWLISATVKSRIPSKTILIISLDKTIHKIMLAKQFCSILVYPRSLIDPDIKFAEPFEEVMMTRLALMRVISHFGFNYVMYDSDAVILKDPQPLYDALSHEDIIGSVGKIPYDLADAWGITICIGVVLVRSSPEAGKYSV